MMAINRRELITAALSAGLAELAPAAPRAAPAGGRARPHDCAGYPARPAWDPDEGVTAPEDLMKEHGVLNRCLLIYEEGVRRLNAKQEVSPNVFNHTAKLIKLFVEEYHEKNEENHIFPVFKKAGKLTDLVHTLETQHKAGRLVTGSII